MSELTIEKLVYGGDGLGRLPEGEVLFVPWSAPGDQVSVTRQTGNTKPIRADINQITQPGPDRVTPPCSVFGRCGGCQWQHISPAAQRDWKRTIVQESLTRIGKLDKVEILHTLGADDTAWHYRNRVQWDIEPESQELTASTVYHLGYHAAQSHDVVEFDHCHIIPDALNALALSLRDSLRSQPELASGILRIEALMNRQGEILLIIEGEKTPHWAAWTQNLQQVFPAIQGIAHRDSAKKQATPQLIAGQGHLMETIGGHTYRVSAGSFFQTNIQATEAMLKTLEAWMIPDARSLLDLYAGVGVFAIHFCQNARRILAIESAKSAIEDAEENKRLNQAEHVELKTGDARRLLQSIKEKFDVAIIDPPRGGCQPEVLDWLSTHIQQQLLYVSCNPTTLARDLKRLSDQGWQVEAVQPIDMFPQTYHIECVARLTR